MLDIQVWVEATEEYAIIRHAFYQKPVTSPLFFHSKGAHGWKSKIITLAEEYRRRLLHMDLRYSMDDKREVIMDFIQKMVYSGYSHPARVEIITSTTKKYC